MPRWYGWVREVIPDSPADLAGVQPGDLLRSVNGQPVRDLVDYRFYQADEELALVLERPIDGQPTQVEVRVVKDADEDLGVLFGEEPAPFIRQCANKCVFCFIKGLPERHQPQRGLPLGMRSSLYIKDDDYRYSFLFGNFITLTNLKEKDWQRLEEQRLSPLYVSVHATDPELRRKMVDGPRAGEVLEHLERLGKMGIQAHTQLVLCPRINDGAWLDKSIADLAALRPMVQSIAAVPVGLTKHNNMLKVGDLPALRPYTIDEAQAVVRQVQGWQKRFEAELGEPFVYLSDEWYFLTWKKFPPARHYGAFEQIENGVGMTRAFLDGWRRQKRRLPAALPRPTRLTMITSAMAAPILFEVASDLSKITNLEARALPVMNQFWGPLVTVAGLLCGQDVLDVLTGLKARGELGDLVVLPRVMLDNAGERFLDDLTVADFKARVPARVEFARYADELGALIHRLVEEGQPATAAV
jgi:putative radical SAM enzyme (TIGR03279 family)